MRFSPGCGCCGTPDITQDARCPCDPLPPTLFLTFSRQLAGLYVDSTLTYGPAPTGWEEWAGASAGPGNFLPNSSLMWWSDETFTGTYFTTTGTFATATKTWKYAFACYKNGTTYHQRVWRFSNDGQDLGTVEVFISKQSSPPGAPVASGGTFACSPFSHAVTMTHSNWIHADLDERPRYWNGATPSRLLTSPIDYLLSE